MADNVTLNTGSGGATAASDDIGGIQFQRVKLTLGADGTNDGDVASGNPMPVSAASLPLPSGAATAANQSTIIGHVDGIEGLLSTIDADTGTLSVVGGGAEATALRVTIANDSTGLVSIDDGGGSITVDVGGTVTVDGSGVTQPVSGTVTANLSATDNAVLDTIASPVVTISSTPLQRVAIFDASDAQITSFGGGTQYTEGDTDATITGTALMFEGAGNALVAAPGTAADGLLVNLGANNDVTVTGTVTADAGTGPWPVTDNSGSLTVDAPVGTPVYVRLSDGASAISTLPVSLASVPSHAVTNAGTFATQVTSIAAGTNNIGDVDVLTVPSDPFGANADAASASGSISAKLRYIASTGIPITGTVTVGSHAVTNAGTFAVQASSVIPGTGATNLGKAEDAAHASGDTGVMALTVRSDTAAATAGTTGDYQPLVTDSTGRLWCNVSNTVAVSNAGTFAVQAGQAAHDAAISGNPVRIAGRAVGSEYSAVASGDTADLACTTSGRLIILPWAHPNNTWIYAAASGGITTTTGATARAAQGAGTYNYITAAQIINGHATQSTEVQIRSGASGAVMWRGWAQAGGGGVSVEFTPPLRADANTLVEVACASSGSATYFNLQGYTSSD